MKYLVLDLDGTLLNDSKQISKEDAEAISALSDDCGLIFASGRHFSEISNYLKIFKRKPSFVICCDGVNTYDENGKRIGNRQTTLNEDDFKALLEIVKKGSILIICDSKNMVFRDNLLSRARRLFKNNKTERYIVGNKLNAEKMRIRKKYVDKNTFESLRKFFSVHIVFNCFADVKRKGVSKYSAIKMICFIIFGIAALVIGAKLTINSATEIARALHVSERIIGLTIIAFGTSLPELVTCISAAIKKHSDIVIGNIIGSNLFNILFVLGITGLIKPIPFEHEFLIDSALGIVATILLWIFVIRDKKLNTAKGIIFFVLYVLYVIYLIK